MTPKVGLVLGAGGLRGFAHIGVLKVLTEEKIPIDCIVGCSIGSIIGALYCAGIDPNNIYKLAKTLKKTHWLDFIVPKMGMISGVKLYNIMRILTKQMNFSELNIPLSIVAVELTKGREHIFTDGEVALAVRASTAIPGIFIPFEIDGKLYVDGAVLNPNPIDIARKMNANIVIAVDLMYACVKSKISNIFDVIFQTIGIVENELFKWRQDRCDILIRPEVKHISPSSFQDVDECVKYGEEATRQVISKIKDLLAKQY